jgi:hypothetical protein
MNVSYFTKRKKTYKGEKKKIYPTYIYSSQNVSELYLDKDFFKMWFKAIFLSKTNSFYLFVVAFLYISAGLGVIYDSQATNRSTDRGEGSHTEPSLLRIGRLESYMIPSGTETHCFYSHPD